MPETSENAENLTNFLPSALDNGTAIFAYGSLLDHYQLRELLAHRGRFDIHETSDLAEAERLVKASPRDLIILKNVRLEGVRVTIVTGTMLRRWYENQGGDLERLIEKGVTPREAPRAVFLYARPAEALEKGRRLNGALIFNLTVAELRKIDDYEFEPVLKRTPTPELVIENRIFAPRRITFYAGTVSFEDQTDEEKAERSALLNLNRKRGQPSPQAAWGKNVRRARG